MTLTHENNRTTYVTPRFRTDCRLTVVFCALSPAAFIFIAVIINHPHVTVTQHEYSLLVVFSSHMWTFVQGEIIRSQESVKKE